MVQENSGAQKLPALEKPLACGRWGNLQRRLIILFRRALRREKRACETNGELYLRIEESAKRILSSRPVLNASHSCSLETLRSCIGTRKESSLDL